MVWFEMTLEKNLLIVSPKDDVFNPKKGVQVRINNLVIQLIKKKNVIILEPEEFIDPKYKFNQIRVEGFRKCTPTFLIDLNIFFHLKLFDILRREKISLIQISFPIGIIAAKISTKLSKSDVPIIYDAHNVEGVRIKKAKLTSLPSYKKVVAPFLIPKLERISVKLADHILSVSSDDKELFIKKYNINPEKITVIPSGANIIDTNSLKDRIEVREKFGITSEEVIIVFHGTYTYHPNKEAIDLIADYIAPKIEELSKNVKFLIAGKDVPEFERGNLKGVGFVGNLFDFLNASDIAIVPLLRGGGTKLKVFDYMSVGLPIVSTKKGMEGIKVENGEEAIIVDDVNEDFIDAIKYLIDNEEERKRLGANARRLAEEEYDWDKIGEKLDRLYRGLLGEKSHENK